jgi:uncharacterized membrane protein
MTEQEASSGERALERVPASENHTKLDRLAARLLDNLSADDNATGTSSDMAVMLSEKFSGPFAHPAVLAELDKVIENGAERAFGLTEKEQEHRHAMEKLEVNSVVKHRDKDAIDRRLVIILVFTFLTLCLAGAFASIMTGHAAGAGLVGGAAAIITAAALLIARYRSKKDLM